MCRYRAHVAGTVQGGIHKVHFASFVAKPEESIRWFHDARIEQTC